MGNISGVFIQECVCVFITEHGIYLLIHVWVVFYMDKSMCGKNIPTSTCLHIATFSNLGYVSSEVEFSCQNVQPFGT